MTRSKGVTFIGWWFVVVDGIGGFLAVMLRIINPQIEMFTGGRRQLPVSEPLLITLILSIGFLAGGIGVLQLKEWGRKLIITVNVCQLLSSAVYVFPHSRMLSMLSMSAFNLLFILFLLRRGIVQQFHH